MVTNSLFDSPWWLDAVAPGAWNAVEVRENGDAVARLPFARRSRLGRTVLTQPPLTPALGPALAPANGKYSRRLELEKERLGALIEQLPPFDFFRQSFAPDVTNWLPFYWAGFSASVRYTYRLEDLTDLDAVWAGFADSVRGHVRKAERELEVRDDLPFEDFLALHEMTFSRQGAIAPSAALVRRIEEACRERGARDLLFAVDAQGRPHAAVYVVRDERAAFYLMSGRNEELAARGAVPLLIWTAIQRAAATSRVFDFEGSMIEPIERFVRSFGGRQVPYFRVEKVQGLLRPLQAARELALWATRRPSAA
jgi:hypothetical protein